MQKPVPLEERKKGTSFAEEGGSIGTA